MDNAENTNHKNPVKYVHPSAYTRLHPEPEGYHTLPSNAHNADTETVIPESGGKQWQLPS